MTAARNNRAAGSDRFHKPGELSTLRTEARREFVGAIGRVAPYVIDHLRAWVLPTYRRAVDPVSENPTWGAGLGPGSRWGIPSPDATNLRMYDSETGLVQVYRLWHGPDEDYMLPTAVALTVPEEHREAVRAGLREVERLLRQWAQQFHLQEEWILDDALATVRYWAAGRSEPWIHRGPIGTPTIIPPQDQGGQWVRLFATAWDIGEGESRADAKKRMLRMVEEQVETHLDQMARWAKAQGFEKVPYARVGRGKEGSGVNARHLDWLVLYQCLPMELEEIAEKYFTSQATVKSGLRNTAKLIDLTLRKRRRGRPPKQPG